MKTATAQIEGLSPLQQGRYHQTEKLEKESPEDYETRTWREKAHVSKDGYVLIPAMGMKKCVEKAASMLSAKIKGRGKATYTKHFLSGIMVTEPPKVNFLAADMIPLWVFGNSMGKRGSAQGGRVAKCFPTIPHAGWKATATFYILDEIITKDIFEKHLIEAGNFVGLCVIRPENGGYYGRFKVNDLTWE